MSNDQELFDAIAAEEPQPADLTGLRKKARELKELYILKAEQEARVAETQSKITKMERSELVQMFADAQVSGVDVDGWANYPPFRAERETVYTAKIPDDKRMEAFQWFESQGHGDLVKSVINIFFGMQEHERRLEVMALLDAHGIQYYPNESIHHQTLRAFVKREIKKNHILPRELLGVYVFDEVKIKEE